LEDLLVMLGPKPQAEAEIWRLCGVHGALLM
jgi:hypothetical protein